MVGGGPVQGEMRRPYDVGMPLLTPMHYAHLLHDCVLCWWVAMKVDSGIRRIALHCIYMYDARL